MHLSKGVKYSSLYDLVESILRFEVDNELFGIRIKQEPFWDYLRYSLFVDILAEPAGFRRGKGRIHGKNLREFGQFVWMRFCTLFRKQRQYDILLVSYAPPRYIDGKKADIYMWPIARILSCKYRVLLLHLSETPINKKDYPCDIVMGRPTTLFNRLRSLFVSFKKHERNVFASLRHRLNKDLGVDVDVAKLAREVFAFQIICQKYFLKFLEEVRPRLVLYLDSGNMKGMIKAANQLEITNVVVQHALMSPLNPLYRYHAEVPESEISETLPDYILTFGEFWNHEFMLPRETIAVGFPYYENTVSQYRQKRRNNDGKSILIASVPLPKKELARIGVELASLLPDHTIYYKLRREEYQDWRAHYPREFSTTPNLKVIDSVDQSIYEYFFICDYVISTNSTALYEGLSLGLLAFILRTGRYEEVRPLFEGEYAFLVETADDIAEKIRAKAAAPNQLDRNALFKDNSEENLQNVISRLMNRRSAGPWRIDREQREGGRVSTRAEAQH